MFRGYNKFLSVKFFTAPQFLKNLNKRKLFKLNDSNITSY